ncbi:SRPBCC domain-containing protein [Streptomyces sp. NPDC004629]|uniref:SRPBCC domain-containing protein n=1 Tax=Streptomyces sp. NPDC004629 TaxID=3364705 RepID=UPI0036BC87FC
MYATRVSRRVRAPRAAVYRALLDPAAVALWRVPDGMAAVVHSFDAREDGAFRVSLSYDDPHGTGKSGPHTDTYHGRFTRLVPDELIVETIEFETDEEALRGPMTLTTSLTEEDGVTEVVMFHKGIPDVVPREDNELGTRMALDKLVRLVEGRERR